MTARVLVLGPLAVEVSGREVALGGVKQRTVLALLAAAEGRAVTVQALLDALWDDDPGDKAAATLQVHVSNVRKALAAAGDGAPRVEHVPDGYRLDLAGAELDVVTFRGLCADGAAARARDDAATASARYGEALALWRGAAYADLAEVRAVTELAVALDEDRLVAVERRIDAELLLGRHAEQVSELQRLVRAHPLRERFWEQLLLALYRSGRQADALAAYATVRRQLLDELGVDPGEPLRRLEAAILAQDPVLDAEHTPAARVDATLRADDGSTPPAALVAAGGSRVALAAGRCVLGRQPGCTVVVDDPKVSRRHAEIVGTPGGYVLSDLGSTNGSYVNDELTSTRLLADGDRLTLGSTTWTFSLEALPDGPARA